MSFGSGSWHRASEPGIARKSAHNQRINADAGPVGIFRGGRSYRWRKLLFCSVLRVSPALIALRSLVGPGSVLTLPLPLMPLHNTLKQLAVSLAMGAAVVGCANTAPKDPILPHDTFTLESAAVGELRRINVYTPPGYEEGDRTYPVLYMPDGGIEEDFPHITNTVDSLIREGAIVPVLVVGIENTVRRRDLNGPTTVERDLQLAPQAGGSSNFRAFIGTELMPEIERRYRVTDQTAIVGESAAGSFVVETFFLEPGLFDRYIAMDPALYWNNRELVHRAAERLPGLEGMGLTLWLTAANTPEIQPATNELASILETHAPSDLRWTYDPRPNERHTTIFRATKEDAFRWALWKDE